MSPDELLELRHVGRDLLAVDQLGEADDRVERRAQLVRHVGEELALEPAGFVNAPVLHLEPQAARAEPLELLLLGEIEREGDDAVFVEQRPAHQHRHVFAVGPRVLLLVWLRDAGGLQIFAGERVDGAPLFGRDVPREEARLELFPGAADQGEEGVIRLEHVPSHIGLDHAQEARIAQPLKARLAAHQGLLGGLEVDLGEHGHHAIEERVHAQQRAPQAIRVLREGGEEEVRQVARDASHHPVPDGQGDPEAGIGGALALQVLHVLAPVAAHRPGDALVVAALLFAQVLRRHRAEQHREVGFAPHLLHGRLAEAEVVRVVHAPEIGQARELFLGEPRRLWSVHSGPWTARCEKRATSC
ncbi:MAG: hypothetical protein Q8N23_12310 [Archangium sp.]|nr:hypothetical protein [Archangium sp.]MDP3574688.1 hypothetical protein [Archangium sp.]